MRRSFALASLSFALAATSCAGAPNAPSDPTPPAAPKKSEPVRRTALGRDASAKLPADVTPTKYVLDLDVDPAKERFAGTMRIDVELAAPRSWIVLHARDLVPSRVVARRGGSESVGEILPRDNKHELAFWFEPALSAGRYTLEIAYDAPFSKSLDGLYRAKDKGRDYAFTQFEPVDARRAFPCFDEPHHKTPFELSVRVPKGMMAVANAPEVARSEEPAHVRFAFAPTLPIPTYLVALAVGDFDVVEGRKSPFPVRIVTTKGRGASAQAALAPATAMVDAIAKYLGVPYPYPKLDLVSVPDFGAGAMENPGLITFREELLLIDPSRRSPGAIRSRDSVIAHEMAHQWFGNLVTMAWWDDLWLNESFASWMGERILEELHPEYKTGVSAVRGGLNVMDQDALPSARPVRREIASAEQAADAFDGMTYEKGAAVIRMIERAATTPKFREGLKVYLEKHAFRTARSEDFVAAISGVSSTPVDAIAKTFLEQTGVPTLSVERDCQKGKGQLVLTQYPWSPLGAAPPAQPLKQWAIPVCVREAGREPTCITMSERRVQVPLGNGCNGWAYPNASQGSYVRLALSPRELQKLLPAVSKLDDRERVGLLANVWAATRAGELSPADLFATLKAFDGERERAVIEQSLDVLWGIGAVLGEGEPRARLAELVRARLRPRKQALGWGAADALLGKRGTARALSPIEEDEAHFMRRGLLFTLGELGEDDETLREADTIARAWLADPKSVEPEIGATALELASRRADASRFDALLGAAKKAEDPGERIAALRALGAFGDPNLVSRALDLVLDQVSLKDSRYVFDGASRNARSRPLVLAWVQANWDRALARFQGHQARRLVGPVHHLCDRGAIERARAFYSARPIEGGARWLEDAFAQASRCSSLAERLREPLARALPAGPASKPPPSTAP